MAGNGHGPTPDELIVGLLLARPELLRLAADIEVDHFELLKLRVTWEAIRNVEARGQTLGVEPVLAELDQAGNADALSDGGPDGARRYLAGLVERMPADPHVPAVELELAELRARKERRDTERGETMIAARDAEPDEQDARPAPELRSVLAVDVAAIDTPPLRSYSTGLPDLDALIGGGLTTRQLITVLGPPGAGKSAWAIATAIRIAQRLHVLYVSTELEQHELMARIAGNLLERLWSAIARGSISKQTLVDALAGVQIHILGCDVLPRDGAAALVMIEREARAIVEIHGEPPLVIVDYLQDLARGAERDLRGRIGDVATDLRSLAQRLDLSVLAVSSVARAYYSARKAEELRELDDPTAYLAAAKESGDVDYASAVVLFLDVEDDRGQPERSARIAVAKSRHGRPGFAGARFAGATGRWTSEPGSVEVMSRPGQVAQDQASKIDAIDRRLLEVIVARCSAGQLDRLTTTQLRHGGAIRAQSVGPALERLLSERLVEAREITIPEVGRRGAMRARLIYVPAGAPAVPGQLAMDGIGDLPL